MKKFIISTVGLVFAGFMFLTPVSSSNKHGETLFPVKSEVVQYTNTHGET